MTNDASIMIYSQLKGGRRKTSLNHYDINYSVLLVEGCVVLATQPIKKRRMLQKLKGFSVELTSKPWMNHSTRHLLNGWLVFYRRYFKINEQIFTNQACFALGQLNPIQDGYFRRSLGKLKSHIVIKFSADVPYLEII